MRVLTTTVSLWMLAVPALAQSSPPTVLIRGEAGQTVTLTPADLDALPQASVTLSHDGQTLSFSGARLDAVIAEVDAPLGKALHGAALSDVIVVKASDGYRVTLALSDVDPTVRSDAAILMDKEDGKPLGKDGPFRLAVGGDLKAARSARNVIEVDVLRLP